MTSEWIVVIEANPPPAAGGMSLATIRELMGHLSDMHPTTLYSPDTYALQLTVDASSAAEALFVAVSTWRAAEAALELPAWRLARVEVITPEEFERERQVSASRSSGDGWGNEKTEREVIEERLLQQAFHDSLTGLPNGELFLDHLQRALRRAERVPAAHALLLCDLDNFHAVNEGLGEDAADEVLLAVADGIVAALRPGDTVARIGADRFAVLLKDVSGGSAEAVAARLLQAVRESTGGSYPDVVLTGAVGIAMSEPGDDGDSLMGQATHALSKAKESGNGRYAFFDPEYRPRDLARIERPLPKRPEKLAYVGLLQAAATASNEGSSLEDAARVVLRQVCAHTGWPVGHLYVVSEEDPGRLDPSGVWYTAAPERFAPFVDVTAKTPLARGVGLPGAVLASGSPGWVADVSSQTAFVRAEEAAAAGLCAGFAFPVLVGEEVVGVLEFYSEDHVDPDRSFWDVMTGVGTQLGRVVERERAAAALRRSEEQFRALVQHSSDMVSVLDPDGTLRLHFGPRVLGYQEGEKVGRPVWELVHPDDLGRAMEALAELVSRRGPGSKPFEVRIRHADGSWRWIEVVGNNLLDNPDVRGLVLNSRDITDRKLAEVALRESEQRLCEAQAMAQVGAWRCEQGPAGSRMALSDVVFDILDLDPSHTSDALEGMLSRVHPQDSAAVRAALEEAWASSGPLELEYRIRRLDGTVRWVRLRAGASSDDSRVRVGTLQDITDRKMAEVAVRHYRSQWEAVEEFAGVGTWRVERGLEGERLRVSRGFSRTFGWEPAGLLTLDMVLAAVLAEDRESLVEALALAWRGFQRSVECRIVRSDGDMRTVAIRVLPLRDDHGVIVGLRGLTHDVTGRRQPEHARLERRGRGSRPDHSLGGPPAPRAISSATAKIASRENRR